MGSGSIHRTLHNDPVSSSGPLLDLASGVVMNETRCNQAGSSPRHNVNYWPKIDLHKQLRLTMEPTAPPFRSSVPLSFSTSSNETQRHTVAQQTVSRAH